MFLRCPKAWIRDEAAAEAALLADVMRYREHHTLPYAGGWNDQPASFTDAAAVVELELSRAREAAGVANGKDG